MEKEFKNTLPIEEGLKLFEQKQKTTNTPEKKLKKRDIIRIDTNDHFAFLKHLFNNDLSVFLKLRESLREIHHLDDAKSFINEHFYNPSWDEKTTYTERFFGALEKYYAKN